MTMAAMATATATDTEADRLNTAAITGSPADPTFGAEAVNADSALQLGFNDFLSFTGAGRGVGTPPIAGGGKAYPAQNAGDASGNYPPGYVQTAI